MLASIVLMIVVRDVRAEPLDSEKTPTAAEQDARHELVVAVLQWIRATNAGDFDAQMTFYPDRMDAFYLWRNTSRAAVLAEKRKVFEAATTIEINVDAPQIIVEAGAKTARTYFRKTYKIDGSRRGRTGAVLQELRWEKQADGWKIMSERDLRVIRQARR